MHKTTPTWVYLALLIISLDPVGCGRQQPSSVTPNGNVPAICVAFSPDAKAIAAGTWDPDLHILDSSPKETSTLKGHTDSITCVEFSHDGTMIVTGSKDRTVRLWNLGASTPLSTLAGHKGAVNSVSFSHDDAFVISASDDGSVLEWNLATETSKRLCSGTRASLGRGMQQSLLAVVDGDRVRMLNWPNGEPLQFTYLRDVHCIAMCQDGTKLAAGGFEGIHGLKIWTTSDVPGRLAHRDRGTQVISLSFSRDGRFLACARRDGFGCVEVWDTATGICTAQVRPQLSNIRSDLLCCSLSPDGRYLVTGGGFQANLAAMSSGMIQVFDLSTIEKPWQKQEWSGRSDSKEDFQLYSTDDESDWYGRRRFLADGDWGGVILCSMFPLVVGLLMNLVGSPKPERGHRIVITILVVAGLIAIGCTVYLNFPYLSLESFLQPLGILVAIVELVFVYLSWDPRELWKRYVHATFFATISIAICLLIGWAAH